jgi:hypothetical protein
MPAGGLGVVFQMPYLHKSKDPDWTRSVRQAAARYRVETTNGQLAERYHIKRTWAKDLWHFCHGLIRKILSHMVLALVAFRAGHSPLRFNRLMAA